MYGKDQGAQFSALEVLTGVSCLLNARGPPLSTKMGENLLAAMRLESPPYGRYWTLAMADLDITAAKVVVFTAYLLVAYPKAAPVPPAAFRELLGGLL